MKRRHAFAYAVVPLYLAASYAERRMRNACFMRVLGQLPAWSRVTTASRNGVGYPPAVCRQEYRSPVPLPGEFQARHSAASHQPAALCL